VVAIYRQRLWGFGGSFATAVTLAKTQVL